MIGSGGDGSDISDESDGFFFPGTPFTSQSDVRTIGWRGPGEEDGVFFRRRGGHGAA